MAKFEGLNTAHGKNRIIVIGTHRGVGRFYPKCKPHSANKNKDQSI